MHCNYNYPEIIADETWLSVFQHLNAKELCFISSVSTRMYAIAQDETLWKKLSFEEYPDSSADFQEKNITQLNNKKGRQTVLGIWKDFFSHQTKFYIAAYQNKLEKRYLVQNSPFDSLSIFKDTICSGTSQEKIFFGDCENLSEKIQWASSVKIDMDREGHIRFYTGHRDSLVRIWNEAFELEGELVEHTASVYQLETNRGHLISAGLDGKICVWDTNEMKCLNVLKHPSDARSYTNLTCNESKLIASTPGGRIDIWDNQSHELLKTLKEKQYSIQCIKAWQNKLFCSTTDSMSIWDLNELCLISRVDHLGQIGKFEIYDDRIFYVQKENPSAEHLSICNAKTLKIESKTVLVCSAKQIGCIRVNALGIFCTISRGSKGLLQYFLSDKID